MELLKNVFIIFKILIPILTCIIALVLTSMLYNLGLDRSIAPDILLVVIFFWIIARPSVMNFVLVFILGVIADVVYDSLIGSHPLVYLLIWAIVIYNTKIKIFRSAYGVYLLQIIIILVAYIIYWIIDFTKSENIVSIYYVFSAILTVGISPILHLVLNAVDSWLRKLDAN